MKYLYCHQHDLDNLKNEFPWEFSLGFPLLAGVHEEVLETPAQSVFHVACTVLSLHRTIARDWVAHLETTRNKHN